MARGLLKTVLVELCGVKAALFVRVMAGVLRSMGESKVCGLMLSTPSGPDLGPRPPGLGGLLKFVRGVDFDGWLDALKIPISRQGKGNDRFAELCAFVLEPLDAGFGVPDNNGSAVLRETEPGWKR